MGILLGCIADDLTGATDVALMLATHGMNTSLFLGIPAAAETSWADAIVIALKTRTVAPDDAVAESLAASRWLRAQGASQQYFKYCSTFDSTDAGNIGPVAEALLDEVGGDRTVFVPAFPANGRTVYQGHLFVGDHLLSETGMRDHPLTPMRDANIVRVLQRQVSDKTSVGLVSSAIVSAGADAIRARVDELHANDGRFVVVDAIADRDLLNIGAACDRLALLTGGSGLAMGLPRNFRRVGLLADGHGVAALPALPGPTAILAGSCSEATRGQIDALSGGVRAVYIDAEKLLTGEINSANLLDDACGRLDEDAVLVYSSAEPDRVGELQERFGRAEVSNAVERATGDVAAGLAAAGVCKFIVAGGETSGAVAQALQLTEFRIGPEIEPGVPWTIATGASERLLAFKSGNFGSRNFFRIAMGMLQ